VETIVRVHLLYFSQLLLFFPEHYIALTITYATLVVTLMMIFPRKWNKNDDSGTVELHPTLATVSN
jgi:uncharacterized membrane protein